MSVMLVGVGIGLIVARYGNMGPFQGEFGSPWFEMELGETIRKEVARAARFDRELSLVVVRADDGRQIVWADFIRSADGTYSCRNGWTVLILPETSKDGAQVAIERVSAELDVPLQAVIMDPTVSHLKPEKLGEALLDLVRNAPPARTATSATILRDTDRLRWPAG